MRIITPTLPWDSHRVCFLVAADHATKNLICAGPLLRRVEDEEAIVIVEGELLRRVAFELTVSADEFEHETIMFSLAQHLDAPIEIIRCPDGLLRDMYSYTFTKAFVDGYQTGNPTADHV